MTRARTRQPQRTVLLTTSASTSRCTQDSELEELKKAVTVSEEKLQKCSLWGPISQSLYLGSKWHFALLEDPRGASPDRRSFPDLFYKQTCLRHEKEPKPKLLSPDIFWWVGVFHVKGWGPKTSVCPSKPRESNFFGGISRDFAGISWNRPKSLRKNVWVQFLAPIVGDDFDWTTGIPCDGNEWRKHRVAPRGHPLRPCVLLVLIDLEAKGLLDFQGRRGIASVVRGNLRPFKIGVEFGTATAVSSLLTVCRPRRQQSLL